MARVARFKVQNDDAWYHLYSRVAGCRGQYPLSDEASTRELIETIKHYSNIYFCEVAIFSIMGSHFLCGAPHKKWLDIKHHARIFISASCAS